MEKDSNILVVIGTARKGRYSGKVARYIKNELSKVTQNVELLDVRDFLTPETIPSWQKEDFKEYNQLSDAFDKADAYYFVLPEYNHSYPGEFKIMIDKLKNEPAGKPVVVCGVSSGVFGGSRVVEHVIPLLTYFKMKTIMPALYFSNVEKLFDEKEKILDTSHAKRIIKTFELVNNEIKDY